MHLLVGNPTAQSGKNAERIDEARAVMDRLRMRHDFLATRDGGKTIDDVARALQSGVYSTVIAMGGDGTFNEVARGLIASGTDLPMGVLPTGTANDQGRSFGLYGGREHLERNLEAIRGGQTTPCDGCRVQAWDALGTLAGTTWFFDSLGWGISARILRMRNEDRRIVNQVPILRELYRDQLVYAGAMMRAFMASYVEEQKFEAEVTTSSGERFFLSGLTDLVVKNTRIYAGAWVFDDTAEPDDGAVELVPFKGRHEWIARAVVSLDGLPIVPSLTPAGALSPITRATAFDIRVLDRTLGHPVEAQIDGEEFVNAQLWRVETVKHAIRLLVPTDRKG